MDIFTSWSSSSNFHVFVYLSVPFPCHCPRGAAVPSPIAAKCAIIMTGCLQSSDLQMHTKVRHTLTADLLGRICGLCSVKCGGWSVQRAACSLELFAEWYLLTVICGMMSVECYLCSAIWGEVFVICVVCSCQCAVFAGAFWPETAAGANSREVEMEMAANYCTLLRGEGGTVTNWGSHNTKLQNCLLLI